MIVVQITSLIAREKGRANLKITIVLLAVYAIVGVFHSCREYYRSRQQRGDAVSWLLFASIVYIALWRV